MPPIPFIESAIRWVFIRLRACLRAQKQPSRMAREMTPLSSGVTEACMATASYRPWARTG